MIGIILVIIIWLLAMLTSLGYYSRPISRRDSRREHIPVYHSEDISDELVEHIAVTHNERKDWKVQNRLGNEDISTSDMTWLRPEYRVRAKHIYHKFTMLRNRIRWFLNRHSFMFSKPKWWHYLEFLGYKHRRGCLVVAAVLLFVNVALVGYLVWPTLLAGLLASPFIIGMAGVSNPQIYVVQSDDLGAEVTAAVALSAKEIHIDPTYTYTVTAAITDDLSGITIDGHGSTIEHTAGVHIFNQIGTTVGNRTVDGDTDSGQTTVVLTGDGFNISVGDKLIIYDDQTLYGAQGKTGELITVEAVSEAAGDTTITTETNLYYSYTVGDNAMCRQLSQITGVTFRNINFIGADAVTDVGYALRMVYVNDIIIENCTFDKFADRAVHFSSCANVKVTECYFHDSKHASNGYGISALVTI